MVLLAERPTPPSECALVFVIPTTEAEFARDCRRGPACDFAYEFAGRPEVVEEDFIERCFRSRYSQEVRIIEDVIRTADSCGVRVVRGLELAGFAAYCRRFHVITLVTHWKPSRVFRDDVRDPFSLASRIRDGHEPLAWISNRLSQEERRIIEGTSGDVRQLQDLLASVLTRCVEEAGVDVDIPKTSRDFWAFQNRDRLDQAVFNQGILAPGNRVEFSDGLHTIDDVVASLPAGFDGVLDLSICNSIFLAEAIRRRCPGCRRVLANEDPTTPGFRLLILKQLYKVLNAGSRDYLAVLGELRERLALSERGKR